MSDIKFLHAESWDGELNRNHEFTGWQNFVVILQLQGTEGDVPSSGMLLVRTTGMQCDSLELSSCVVSPAFCTLRAFAIA